MIVPFVVKPEICVLLDLKMQYSNGENKKQYLDWKMYWF